MTQSLTGAQLVALTLRALEIHIVFGVVGIPIIEVAEACVAIDIRFVGFRNEQAAAYAASAYGFLTGRPGVLLVVGGPGVVHALSGIHGSQSNHFPLLVLTGARPSSHLPSKGSFQSLETTSFLTPHTKLALRPSSPQQIPQAIRETYRAAFWGRPGATAVELSANFVTHMFGRDEIINLMSNNNGTISPVSDSPKSQGDPAKVQETVRLIKAAKRPLVIIGKGAAYARCEKELRRFVESTCIPFLPTPMGKGVLPDGHPLDISPARSKALASSDLIILIGARLNWILHFGASPKVTSRTKIVKIDISAEEIGRNLNTALDESGAIGEELGIVGDCALVLNQLNNLLRGWTVGSNAFAAWVSQLASLRSQNQEKQIKQSCKSTLNGQKLQYQRTFYLIQQVLHSMVRSTSPPDNLVFVSEGANTMDISRSIFKITEPRQRLDAGTDATMGIGLGYAIAAWCAYNLESQQGGKSCIRTPPGRRKRIIAIEGDSAFGFSGMEIETMARYNMDIIIIVINNGGVYRGVNYSPTSAGATDGMNIFAQEESAWNSDIRRDNMTLPSTALSYGSRYALIADALGGKGYEVRGTGASVERLLEQHVREAWEWGTANRKPVVIDVGIESGKAGELVFAWLSSEKETKSKL